MLAVRIQKMLADAGLESRRTIETWISAGRITVNGQLAKLGDRVTLNDKVCLDGKLVTLDKVAQHEARVLMYHKPEGEVCTRHDPEGRRTIFMSLPPIRGERWISVGRLDLNTSGLLLVTNDGAIANKLMHPSAEIEREYAVRVLGEVTPEMCQRMQKGVMLEDGLASFHSIKTVGGEGANRWYQVILKEGRKREVRRLWESQGLKVSRLMRIRFGFLTLPRSLRKGSYQEVEPDEIEKLLRN